MNGNKWLFFREQKGQMEHRRLKSEINNSKEIAFESFQTDFQPKRPLCPLKKTATRSGISKNSNF
ncbi:MAG: hypothetical protein LBB88_12275 [Planctomycetaceae bacterium]|nr:hypothetical protein [Planctomycetaceae bacterium]